MKRLDWTKDAERQRSRDAHTFEPRIGDVYLISWWAGKGTQAARQRCSTVQAAVESAWQRSASTLSPKGILKRFIGSRVRCFKVIAFGKPLTVEGWKSIKQQLIAGRGNQNG